MAKPTVMSEVEMLIRMIQSQRHLAEAMSLAKDAPALFSHEHLEVLNKMAESIAGIGVVVTDLVGVRVEKIIKEHDEKEHGGESCPTSST